jgi:hypothetical protein
MASAFSVCALVENWRVEVPPGATEANGLAVEDPRWYVIVPRWPVRLSFNFPIWGLQAHGMDARIFT